MTLGRREGGDEKKVRGGGTLALSPARCTVKKRAREPGFVKLYFFDRCPTRQLLFVLLLTVPDTNVSVLFRFVHESALMGSLLRPRYC